MKNREELIDIYQDTINHVENGEYNSILISEKLKLERTNPRSIINKLGMVIVQNQDCVEVADQLSQTGKTCILNMASYKKPGGGVKTGAMAQEEELARRSNLMYGLPQEFYPLSMNEFIYTNEVTFFKDKYYNIMDVFNCDVITMAAVNLNGLDTPKNYESLMKLKISNLLDIPHKNGCKNLVLSAFGCGVFKNDPYYVATIFKQLLDDGFSSLYTKISFAILNDRNSVGSNYETFKDVLC